MAVLGTVISLYFNFIRFTKYWLLVEAEGYFIQIYYGDKLSNKLSLACILYGKNLFPNICDKDLIEVQIRMIIKTF